MDKGELLQPARGQDIPNIAVGVVFHESPAYIDRKDKSIKKRSRIAKSSKTPSSIVVEQIPEELVVDVESLGNRIRGKRLERGLSLSRLGRLLSVDRTTVREWEAGKVAPRPYNLKRILKWLDERA